MSIEFEITAIYDVPREQLYNAWLNSKEHSAMTGGEAIVTGKEGDAFTAWDGYISGKNIELIPGNLILQSWRTSEFLESEEDSQLMITFETVEKGTVLRLKHSNLPEHGMKYKQGWIDNYFTPMKEYFKK